MAKKLSIEMNLAQVRAYIDFLLGRQKEIKVEISDLEKEYRENAQNLTRLKVSIRSLEAAEDFKDGVVNSDGNLDIYSEKWPWVRKISFAIQYAEKSATTREIVDILSEFEPEFLIDRKRVVASVSSTLSVKTNEVFGKQEGETGEYEYYLLNQKADVQNDNLDGNHKQGGASSSYFGDDELPF